MVLEVRNSVAGAIMRRRDSDFLREVADRQDTLDGRGGGGEGFWRRGVRGCRGLGQVDRGEGFFGLRLGSARELRGKRGKRGDGIASVRGPGRSFAGGRRRRH